MNGIIFDDLEGPPNPGFKVTINLQVEYLKNGAFRDKVKVTKNTNRKQYTIYRMVGLPLSMIYVTSDPDFKVTTFFDIEYLRNDSREPYLL